MIKKSRFLIIILSIVAIILLAGGFVFVRYMNYTNKGLDGLQNAPQPLVTIINPQAYSQAPVDAPLPVDIAAYGHQPLASAELWVNGKRMGVQAVPSGGQSLFRTSFLWFPGGSGEFSLVARILDTQGNSAYSTAVLVNILPHAPAPGADSSVAFDISPALALPAAPVGGADGTSNGGVPGPGETMGPAQVGPPSPGDWLTNLTNKQPPEAPVLAVTVKGCTATLSIHDLSNNEEGFQVFRSTDNSPAWAQIAKLKSQSAQDWMTYQDTLQGAGQASYYAVAVNKIGQAKSNPVTADFSSTDCPLAGGSQQVLTIQALSFTTDLPVDQAYCYQSMNNAQWERWPETGFFLPGPDGFDIRNYGLAFAVNGLDGKPILTTLDLRLECWGWAGGALKYLGQVDFTNDVSNLRTQDEQRGANFTAAFGYLKDNNPKRFFPAQPPYKKGNPNGNMPPKPTYLVSANLPWIKASLSYVSQDCVKHLSPEEQSALLGLIAAADCAPFPGYTMGPGTANPQPYLVWSLSSNPGSLSLSKLETYAQQNFGSLQFVVNEIDPQGGMDFSIPENRSVYNIAEPGPWDCAQGSRQFTVSLLYEDGTVGMLHSPNSNIVTVPCSDPLGSTIPIKVTFNSLTLNNANDGGNDHELELYGSFMATSTDGSQGILNNTNYVFNQANNGCGDDSLGGPPVGGQLGCRFANGAYSLASDMMLCAGDKILDYCGLVLSPNNVWVEDPRGFNNNTIHLTVGAGDSIGLLVMLMDSDVASNADPVCVAVQGTVSKTKIQWANTLGDVYTLHQDDNGNAACDVKVTISVGQ